MFLRYWVQVIFPLGFSSPLFQMDSNNATSFIDILMSSLNDYTIYKNEWSNFEYWE
jgi:hypothetical protein